MGGAAMTRPLRRGIFNRIGLTVAPAMQPAEVTPESLHSVVAGLRGEWR
jgi:hypothetical protein